MEKRCQSRPALLRAQLLLGAAGALAASQSAALGEQMPAADQDKWVPYTDIGGGYGSGMTAGKADAFVPLWQNVDSLLFANLGIGTETKTNQFENFGLGYRTKINPDWILGGYAGFDSTQLEDSNTFNQSSFGAELMSADWDARLNGYIAANKARIHPGEQSLYISGTTIAVMDGEDVGYTGFDGEVGYRVFSTDNTDVRLFLGGFMFGHVESRQTSLGENFDIPYRDIAGPKARAEVTVYDLDILGPQSRLTVGGEVAYDDVRKTTGFIGATLRIPLGNFGGGAQALDELDRRMTDPERRNDTVLTRASFTKPEPVIIYGPHVTSQPTNTLLYVDNTQGVGTYANPTTFSDATSRNTTNAFIVITSKQGPVSTSGATLQPGQTIVPGGQTFTVEGAYSHAKFTHDFDAATNVTLVSTNPNANVITLASNATVYDVTIEGTFANAIYGKNVHDVDISHVTITGSGVGNGIDIERTAPGNQKITIANTSVSDTNVGIRLDTSIAGHGSITGGVTLSNVAISNTVSDGIVIDTYAGPGTTVVRTAALSNVTVTGAGGDGINIYTHANGMGASIAQTLSISNATVTGAGKDGIGFDTYAQNAAAISSVAAMSGLSVKGAAADGLDIDRYATGAQASLAQVLALSSVTVTGAGSDAITVDATAKSGGTIQANDALANVTVTNPLGNGLSATTKASGTGSAVIQAFSLAGTTISGPDVDGVSVSTDAQTGARITSNVSLANAAVTGAVNQGIYDYTGSYGAGSSVTQSLSIANPTVTGTSLNSIFTLAKAEYGGRITDSETLSNVTASGAQRSGVVIAAESIGAGAQVTESSVVSGANFSNEGAFGVRLFTYAAYAGQIRTTAQLSNVNVTNAGTDGIDVLSRSVGNGSSIEQTVTVANATIAGAGFSGVQVSTAALYGAANVSDTLNLSNITVSGPHSHGIYLYTAAYGAGASAYESFGISQATVSSPGNEGIFVNDYAGQGGHTTVVGHMSGIAATNAGFSGMSLSGNSYGPGSILDRTISISNATIGGAVLDGVAIGAAATNGGAMDDSVSLSNINMSGTAQDGVYVSTLASGSGSSLAQTLTLSYVAVTNAGRNGIAVDTTAKSAGAIQANDALSNLTITDALGNGLSAITKATGAGSAINQTFSLTGATISGPDVDGVSVSTDAQAGATIASNVSLANAAVTGATHQGIYDYTGSNGAGSSVTQSLSITNPVLTGASLNGIFTLAVAEYGGHISDSETLSNVAVSGAQRSGVVIAAESFGAGAQLTESSVVSNATLSNEGAFGVRLFTYAAYAGRIDTTAQLTNVNVTNAGQDGIVVVTFGGYGGAIIDQSVTVTNATITGAGLDGIRAATTAEYAGTSVNSALTFSNVTISGARADGIDIYATSSSVGAVLDQTVEISDTTVSAAQYYGINIMDSAGAGSTSVAHVSLSNVTVTGSTYGGIFVQDIASPGGTARQYVSVSDSTISNVGGAVPLSYGLRVETVDAGVGSYVYQSVSVGNVAVSYVSAGALGIGIAIDAVAQNAGAVVQNATISSSSATHSGVGIEVFAQATDSGYGLPVTAHQTVTVADSTFSYNATQGIRVVNQINAVLSGYHSTAMSNQKVSLSNVTADNNGTGVFVSDTSSKGSSIIQNVDLYGIQIEHNAQSGLLIDDYGQVHGLAGQYVTINDKAGSYNNIAFNGSSGITMIATAVTGGQVNQHLNVYRTDLYRNTVYGISVAGNASGYFHGATTYFSRVQQFVTAGYDSISGNGGSGVSIASNVSYEGRVRQTINFQHDVIDHNARYGLIDNANVTSPGNSAITNDHGSINIQYSDLSYNGQSGASFNANVTRPLSSAPISAYGVAVQYISAEGSTFTHNGVSGLAATATGSGVNTIDDQIFTLLNSEFSQNGGDGVHLVAKQTYGNSGLYNSVIQDAIITGSDFSHNAGRGFYARIGAYQTAALARQYIVATNSTFEYNTKSGIRLARYAENGSYVAGRPCSAVQYQGGGCAVTAAYFHMTGGSASNNAGAGISIGNTANNFGAIYAVTAYYAPGGRSHYPSVALSGVSVNHNGGTGLLSETVARNQSYVYSYIKAVDSTFDHNTGFGFVSQTIAYSGSSIVDRNMLYAFKTGTSASYNGKYGLLISDNAQAASAIQRNSLTGVAVNHDGFGGALLGTGTGSTAFPSTPHTYQSNTVTGSHFYNNGGDGLYLSSSGSGSGQHSKLYANAFNANSGYAIEGNAGFEAYQFVGYQTYGNALNGGATKFVTSFGGTHVIQ